MSYSTYINSTKIEELLENWIGAVNTALILLEQDNKTITYWIDHTPFFYCWRIAKEEYIFGKDLNSTLAFCSISLMRDKSNQNLSIWVDEELISKTFFLPINFRESARKYHNSYFIQLGELNDLLELLQLIQSEFLEYQRL